MARGLAAASELLADVAPGQELAGVGAATLGIPYDDRVELAPTFPGWGALPFGQLVRDAFPGIPVRLGTDVKAAAAAELRWGALVEAAIRASTSISVPVSPPRSLPGAP